MVHFLYLQVGMPGASFLNAWLASYENYNPRVWGGNSVVMALKLAQKYPSDIHVEPGTFTDPNYHHNKDMYAKHYNFSNNYCIHIFSENRHFIPSTEEELAGYDCTLGDVMRYVLYGSTKLLSNNTRNGIV